MTNLIRKVGHLVKHGPEIIRQNATIHKLKNQKITNKILVNPKRSIPIVVSLTSYKKRFNTLDICLKSIFNQTMLPDKLVLYLSKDEQIENLPKSVRDMQNYGLKIKFVDLDLRPHKKYYYAMQDFQDDIVITIDDDSIYDKDLIKNLYTTYKEYPNCIISARAHEITFIADKLNSYSCWKQCSTKVEKPSFMFLPTGVGGILYPPHLLKLNLLLNLNYIKKYITVDDLWLKTVELVSKVPVVICDVNLDKKRIEIPSAQKDGLANQNVIGKQNDFFLNQLDSEFKIVHMLKINEKKLRDQTYE